MENKIRPIAIYLPQYHPVPENDEWWGKGFTEWTNVTKAKPLFEGHYQPHLPKDLGFYDLRLSEVRQAQADLAIKYGIYGFCYYHYWFNGRRILERPFQEIFESGKPDFPFMLCWANENWTRKWDGLDSEVLLEQKYSEEDDKNHIESLIQYFKDPRYIRVDNKPVIIIYKKNLLPDPSKTITVWRSIARQHNLELYICHMVFSYGDNNKMQPGFDAAIDFEPFGVRRSTDVFTKILNNQVDITKRSFLQKLLRQVNRRSNFQKSKVEVDFLMKIEYDYYYQNLAPLKSFGDKMYPMVMPGWDNTARKSKNPTLIVNNSTPDKFKQWIRKVIDDFKPYSDQENFVFINAWNEWAEGNHLEPDQKYGTAYLEACKEALEAN